MSPTGILILGLVVGITVLVAMRRAFGSFLSISSLLVANLVVTEQISGIAALTPHNLPFDWNIDLTGDDYTKYVQQSAWISLVALASVSAGIFVGQFRRKKKPAAALKHAIPSIHTGRIYLFAIVCALLALYALPQARGMSSDDGSVHLLQTEVGNYKYIVLSNWLACAAVIVGTAFVAKRQKRAPLTIIVVVAASLLVCVAATSWSGARSLPLLIWLPLVIALWPHVRQYYLPIFALALVIVGSVFNTLTSARQAQTFGLDLFSPLAILDWQWGRFSMTPLALHLTSLVGESRGGTMYAALYPQISFVFNLAHLPMWPAPESLTGNALIGTFTFGAASTIYIPFGLQAELVFNFGWLGVVLGFFAVGVVARLLDVWILRVPHPLMRLLPSYLGSVLVLRALQGNLGGVADLVVFTGLPFIVLHIIAAKALVSSRELSSGRDYDEGQADDGIGPGHAVVQSGKQRNEQRRT